MLIPSCNKYTSLKPSNLISYYNFGKWLYPVNTYLIIRFIDKSFDFINHQNLKGNRLDDDNGRETFSNVEPQGYKTRLDMQAQKE
jgi:hypothetical protein